MRQSLWAPTLAALVAVDVGAAVLLMSVAYGSASGVAGTIADPAIRSSHLVNVELIDSILFWLTLVVTVTSILQTMVGTFALGSMVLRARHEEIANRVGNGAHLGRLVAELTADLLPAGLMGGVVGEGFALTIGGTLAKWTDLRVQIVLPLVVAAVPVAVAAVAVASILAAWLVVRTDVALLGKG